MEYSIKKGKNAEEIFDMLSTNYDNLEQLVDYVNEKANAINNNDNFWNHDEYIKKYVKTDAIVERRKLGEILTDFSDTIDLMQKIIQAAYDYSDSEYGATCKKFLKMHGEKETGLYIPIQYYIEEYGLPEEIAEDMVQIYKKQRSGKMKEPTHDSPKNEILAYYMMYLGCDYETAVDIYNRDKKARGGIPQWEREKAETKDQDDNSQKTDVPTEPAAMVTAQIGAAITATQTISNTHQNATDVSNSDKNSQNGEQKSEAKEEQTNNSQENEKTQEQEKETDKNKVTKDELKEKIEDISINNPLPPELNENHQTIIDNGGNQHQGGGYSSNNNNGNSWSNNSNNWNTKSDNSNNNEQQIENKEDPNIITPNPKPSPDNPTKQKTITTTTIPTNLEKTNTKSASGNKAIPIIAGLGAAAAIGVGTKVYIDNKKNNDNDEDNDFEEYDDEIYADEWNENETEDNNLAEKYYNQENADVNYQSEEENNTSDEEYGEM